KTQMRRQFLELHGARCLLPKSIQSAFKDAGKPLCAHGNNDRRPCCGAQGHPSSDSIADSMQYYDLSHEMTIDLVAVQRLQLPTEA
ncbi:MAG: hypothetical protein J0H54_09905, partial [Rhizobiales bacterium]|nr:hypothetical protein [Hyphomicrobiales bacterium]